ncbi:MAG: DEAD/DEAH box helicase [Bacteroidota bacterium]|nr:DEAD/DEAH box helicase [Bacteroidota bacterium]
MSKFSELGLSKEILQVLPELGINDPTAIQQQAIPKLINDKGNFIGLAQTGTGKTAAFGLPLLERIDTSKKHIQGLVLAPTRELGQQIAQQLEAFGKYVPGTRVQVVYGGASIMDQIRGLKRSPQIVVATPGRLLDLLKRKALSLSRVEHVVLDEADEMLNMGFKEDLDEILSHAPEEKETWLFSATMPKEIRSITKKFLKGASEVTINSQNEVNEDIEHQYAFIRSSDKTEALRRILDVNENIRGIIFCRTKLMTQSLSDELGKQNYKADALHGDMSQAQRERVMKKFKDHSYSLIVATDVAARGIDVNDLTHIIHYSLPDDQAYYTHRSGRTARAGKKGVSLTLASKKDLSRIRFFEHKLKINFNKILIPNVSDIQTKRISQWGVGILDYKASKRVSEDIINETVEKFTDLSKEELIAKLVSKEIEKLNIASNRDLNEPDRVGRDRRDRDGDRRDRSDRKDRGDRRDRRDRGDKRDRRDRSDRRDRDDRGRDRGEGKKTDKFFINLGVMDQINKKEILEFICEQTKIDKTAIGNIRVEKKYSFFDVDKRESKRVVPGFKGLYIGDRKLRVNKDSL